MLYYNSPPPLIPPHENLIYKRYKRTSVITAHGNAHWCIPHSNNNLLVLLVVTTYATTVFNNNNNKP